MAKKNNEDMFFGLTLNEGQENLRQAIMDDNNQVIMVNAVAGSGKTLLSVACARLLTAYHGDKYNGAIYIFPTNQEQTLGFRPGGTQDKEADYLEPLNDALIKLNEVPRQAISSDISEKNGTAWISAKSSTFLRGTNFENKIVIIDECQNFNAQEVKKIISRCHSNCKVLIMGCTSQTDIPINKSCFSDLINYLKDYDHVKVCQLDVSYRGWLAAAIDKF